MQWFMEIEKAMKFTTNGIEKFIEVTEFYTLHHGLSAARQWSKIKMHSTDVSF